MSGTRHRFGASLRRPQFEPLETRWLLAGHAGIATDTVVIAEGPAEVEPAGPRANAAEPILGPQAIVELGDAVVVAADQGLWRLARDGSAAEFLQPVGPAYLLGHEPHFARFGSAAYIGSATAEGLFHLSRTDGTFAGTEEVAAVHGARPWAVLIDSAVIGDSLYFITIAYTGRTLWRSDGTQAGTQPITEIGSIYNGGDYVYDRSPAMTVVNGTLLFNAYTPEHGWELWTSDGTAGGTHLFLEINQGSEPAYGDFNGDNQINLTDFGILKENFGREAWWSDRDGDGLLGLEEFSAFKTNFYRPSVHVGRASANPSALTLVGDEAYFFANDEVHGQELWRTDGTVPGTFLVMDVQPGPKSSVSWEQPPTLRGTEIVFMADDGGHGPQLWQSDGSALGTRMLNAALPPSGLGRFELLVWNDQMFFFHATALEPTGGGETALWRSDGTAEGTQPLAELSPRLSGPSLVAAQGFVFVAARTDDNDIELWRSDGALAGTQFVSQFGDEPAFEVSMVLGMADVLFLSVSRGQGPNSLWRSDGSPEGTLRVLSE